MGAGDDAVNKHTPGPWVAHHNGHYWTVKTKAKPLNGQTVCDLIESEYLYSHDPRSEGAQSNARLIAAAPELLEALQQLREVLHDSWDCCEVPGGLEAWRATTAAIAKATGGQP